MIQLDRRLYPLYKDHEIIGYKTQSSLLPNHFFLNPRIVCDWKENTATLDGITYYLDKMLDSENIIVGIPSEAEWLDTYGNDIQHDYYKGVTSNNPSGNTKNVYRSHYIDSVGREKYILEYWWDENDNCIRQRSIAPSGTEAEVVVQMVTVTYYNEGKVLYTFQYEKGTRTSMRGLPHTSEKAFVGWRSSLGDIVYLDEKYGVMYLQTFNENVEFAPVWKKYTYLRYYDNGVMMKEVKSREDYTENISYTLEDTETHYFDGWAKDGIKVGDTLDMTENTDLEAIWISKFPEPDPEPDPEPELPGSEGNEESEENTEQEGGE